VSGDWPVVNINDLCEVVTKGTTPTSVGHQFTTNGVNFIKVESISSDGRVFKEKLAHISDDCHAKLKRSQILEGDILFSIAGALGRTAVVTADVLPANTNQALSIIRLKQDSGMYNRFLAYFLSSGPIIEQIENARGGAAQQNLSLAQVKAFQVPLPTLDEQKRIVSILDQAFEGLDRARANAEANLESAEELLKSTFEHELRGLDEAQECALSDHIELLTGFAFKSSGYVDDTDGMRLIRGDNVIPGEMRWDGVKKWPRSDTHNYVKYHLQAGDLLIAMDRTWIKSGIKYAVLTEADVPSMLVQRVARLRPKQSLELGFLELMIGSRHFEQYVLSIQTGSGVPHVSGNQIKEYRLKIPSISAQTRISAKFAKLNAHKLSLQLTYRHTLNQADELRQSILQKAFSGGLT